VKCEQVVDIIVDKTKEERENSILLLIKKDNTCEKKLLSAAKTWISTDTARPKRTNYCKKH